MEKDNDEQKNVTIKDDQELEQEASTSTQSLTESSATSTAIQTFRAMKAILKWKGLAAGNLHEDHATLPYFGHHRQERQSPSEDTNNPDEQDGQISGKSKTTNGGLFELKRRRRRSRSEDSESSLNGDEASCRDELSLSPVSYRRPSKRSRDETSHAIDLTAALLAKKLGSSSPASSNDENLHAYDNNHESIVEEEEEEEQRHVDDETKSGIRVSDDKLCEWCRRQTVSESRFSMNDKSFCSENCFGQFRRAAFKKTKMCDWCRTRPIDKAVSIVEKDAQQHFCSEICLENFRVDIFCQETRAQLALHPRLQRFLSFQKNHELAPVIPQALNQKQSKNSGVKKDSNESKRPVVKVKPDHILKPVNSSARSNQQRGRKLSQVNRQSSSSAIPSTSASMPQKTTTKASTASANPGLLMNPSALIGNGVRPPPGIPDPRLIGALHPPPLTPSPLVRPPAIAPPLPPPPPLLPPPTLMVPMPVLVPVPIPIPIVIPMPKSKFYKDMNGNETSRMRETTSSPKESVSSSVGSVKQERMEDSDQERVEDQRAKSKSPDELNGSEQRRRRRALIMDVPSSNAMHKRTGGKF